MKKDWTADSIGISNSSVLFYEISLDIEGIIRSSAHLLINGNVNTVARHITARIAHVHNLVPDNEKELT